MIELLFVHTNRLPKGDRCARIAAMATVLPITRPVSVMGNPATWAQHQADVVRLHALRRWGGVYLDTDAILVSPLSALLALPGVSIGAQPSCGLCNGVNIATREAPPFPILHEC